MNASLVINHSVQQLADNFNLIVEQIRTESQMRDIDLSKSSDRKKVIAAAHRVTKTKTEIARRIKDAISSINDEIAPQIELINKLKSSNKIITAQLSSLKNEIRSPVTEWERLEQERIDNHQSTLASLTLLVFDCDSEQLKAQKDRIESINTDSMQEFELAAYKAKSESIKLLTAAINTAQQREKEAAEQANLEAEVAAEAAKIAAAQADEERQRREVAIIEQERIKRENDELHLLTIKNNARLDIEQLTGLDEDTAYMIVNAIASGSVRNLRLEV